MGTEQVSASKVNALIGVDLTVDKMAALLTKMCLSSTPSGDSLSVSIPPTRHDVLHPCDIYEDVAIAHGYNNITKTIPHTLTVAQLLPRPASLKPSLSPFVPGMTSPRRSGRILRTY